MLDEEVLWEQELHRHHHISPSILDPPVVEFPGEGEEVEKWKEKQFTRHEKISRAFEYFSDRLDNSIDVQEGFFRSIEAHVCESYGWSFIHREIPFFMHKLGLPSVSVVEQATKILGLKPDETWIFDFEKWPESARILYHSGQRSKAVTQVLGILLENIGDGEGP